MGGRCSLACTECTTPCEQDAIAVCAAEPPPPLARRARNPRDVTRPVTSYQEPRTREEVSPYTFIPYSLQQPTSATRRPFRACSNSFPFYRRNVGKRVCIPTLSFNL